MLGEHRDLCHLREGHTLDATEAPCHVGHQSATRHDPHQSQGPASVLCQSAAVHHWAKEGEDDVERDNESDEVKQGEDNADTGDEGKEATEVEDGAERGDEDEEAEESEDGAKRGDESKEVEDGKDDGTERGKEAEEAEEGRSGARAARSGTRTGEDSTKGQGGAMVADDGLARVRCVTRVRPRRARKPRS